MDWANVTKIHTPHLPNAISTRPPSPPADEHALYKDNFMTLLREQAPNEPVTSHTSNRIMDCCMTNLMISVTSMKRRKREEIYNQSKNEVTQHVNDGVLIITLKNMADY